MLGVIEEEQNFKSYTIIQLKDHKIIFPVGMDCRMFFMDGHAHRHIDQEFTHGLSFGE